MVELIPCVVIWPDYFGQQQQQEEAEVAAPKASSRRLEAEQSSVDDAVGDLSWERPSSRGNRRLGVGHVGAMQGQQDEPRCWRGVGRVDTVVEVPCW